MLALATPALPFLPLTATQILLNNLLSDLPALTLSADRVDPAALRRARRWNQAEVRRFMIMFGLISSAFDLLAFALLLTLIGYALATEAAKRAFFGFTRRRPLRNLQRH